jgi:GxxExxY protein
MQTQNNFNSRKEPSKEVDDLARLVIGAAIEVHKTLGPGYVENVYERALKIELEMQKTLYENQLSINVAYKGHPVGKGRLDFLIAKLLPVEIKAGSVLLPVHQAQLISYLKMTGLQLGLLINFNVPLLKNGIKRVIFNS